MSSHSKSTYASQTSVDMSKLDIRHLQALLYREIGISAVAHELFGTDTADLAVQDMNLLLTNLREVQRAA